VGYLKNFAILVGVFFAGLVAIVLAFIAVPLLIITGLGLLAAVIIAERNKRSDELPILQAREVKYEIKPRPRSD
jgi:hypothetical protein